MLAHWPDNLAAPVSSTASREEQPAPRAAGLLTVRISSRANLFTSWTMVAELDPATIEQVRAQALAMRARRPPILIELRYVADPVAAAAIRRIEELAAEDVQVDRDPARRAYPTCSRRRPKQRHRTPGHCIAEGDGRAGGGRRELRDASRRARDARWREPAAAAARDGGHGHGSTPIRPKAVPTPDPFGLDRSYRARWLPPLRFLFERYWRIEVSGLEHVPDRGAALIAANHSGAVPADAFMLSVALELQHRERRVLRVLYDKFVDALPFIGPIYSRLGAVRASFTNAEELLRRGELVGLFPEGIAGVEKRFTERYRLQPFKSGTARLSVRCGSPIVPVAIVGAEEAYPVVARLYRIGNLVGLPWIPITPLFPVCGVAGALPLPSRWHIRFCEPIVPPADARSEEEAVDEVTRQLRVAIASALADMLAKRRSLFL